MVNWTEKNKPSPHIQERATEIPHRIAPIGRGIWKEEVCAIGVYPYNAPPPAATSLGRADAKILARHGGDENSGTR